MGFYSTFYDLLLFGPHKLIVHKLYRLFIFNTKKKNKFIILYKRNDANRVKYCLQNIYTGNIIYY